MGHKLFLEADFDRARKGGTSKIIYVVVDLDEGDGLKQRRLRGGQ